MQYCLSIVRRMSALGLAFFLSTPYAHAEVINIDGNQLKSLIDKGVPVVDVRRADEWQQTGIIKGSHLLTLPTNKAGDAYDVVAWANVFGKQFRPDQPVVLFCRSGRRSGQVAAYLDQTAGYAKVYNVIGGMNGWLGDGNQTVPYEEKGGEMLRNGAKAVK